MIKAEVFYEFNEELKSLWSDFESDANSLPFQSYEWQRYWNAEVGQPKYKMDICIVVCLVDDRVRAIFPFGIKRAMGARILEFLGADEADYSAPLLGIRMDSEEFRNIWIEVLKIIPSYDVVYFKNIPKLINQSDNFLLENIFTKQANLSYSTILPDSFEEYSLRLSKSMLKDNKRMVRRLSELGELKFSVLVTSEDFNRVVEVMISQKESRYTLSGARNIFYDKAVKNFYSNIFTLLNRGFGVHLSALMLDDEILATHLGIRYRDQFYYLMPTFNHDAKWRKFSLGRIHLEKLVGWSIDNGISKFDFTIGGESYKGIWCDSEMATYRHLKIRSFRGVIYYAYFLVLELIKSKPFLKKLAVKILSLRQKYQIDKNHF
jgi:CelD/BcsL family acetyltransferase involved in cellulose biosynthesis